MSSTILAIAALAVLAVPAHATDASPCGGATAHAVFGPVQRCPLWMPKRGSIPVHVIEAGRAREVGRLLHAGSVNWFVCQTSRPAGAAVRYRDAGSPQYTNVWWAKTLSDTGAWGWVSEVHFSGGGNDERDARLRDCSAAEAATPGPVPSAAPPAPALPSPVAAPKPKPKRKPLPLTGACRATRESEQRTISYQVQHRVTSYTGNWVGGAPELKDIYERTFDVGSVSIRVATCQTSRSWRILGGGAIDATSKGIYDDGIPRGGENEGWGVTVLGGRGRRIDVAIPRCRRRGSWQSGAKLLLGLPIPGPWKLGATQFAAGFLVPSAPIRVKCADFARVPLDLSLTANGHLRVDAGGWGPYALPQPPGLPTFDRYEVIPRVR